MIRAPARWRETTASRGPPAPSPVHNQCSGFSATSGSRLLWSMRSAAFLLPPLTGLRTPGGACFSLPNRHSRNRPLIKSTLPDGRRGGLDIARERPVFLQRRRDRANHLHHPPYPRPRVEPFPIPQRFRRRQQLGWPPCYSRSPRWSASFVAAVIPWKRGLPVRRRSARLSTLAGCASTFRTRSAAMPPPPARS